MPWSRRQQIAKVYMNDAAVPSHEYVRIVSVFDLQDIAHQAVRRQAVSEILLGLLEGFGFRVSKVLHEIV